MKVIKTLILVLLISTTIFMTGCWSYREIDTLAIVAGFAIDQGSNGKGYHLTLEVVDTSGQGSGGGGNKSSVQSKIIESDGNTIFDAVRNALNKSDKKLYFGDCITVIFSNQLASKGISTLMDWINRDSELRLSLDLFISKENTAGEVIEQKSLVNPITSYALHRIDQNDQQFLSKSAYVQLYKANDLLGGEGESLFFPVLKVVQNQKDNIPEIDGTAIFKKDKLVGYLGADESKYFSFIMNQIEGGLLLVNEDSTVSNITLEIKKNETKISTILTGKNPKIKIDITTEVALGETETAADFDTEAGLQKLEKDASKTLENNIKELISKVQNEYDSDIFGFGNTIYQDDPYYWNEIKPQWDNIFKSLDVEVTADVEIKNTALTKSNVKAGD